MGSAFPRSFVPLLAAGLVAVAPSLGRIADAGGHPARVPFRATAHVERDGIAYTIDDERAGDLRLERECADDLCTGTWFDGDRLYTLGINGDRFPAGETLTRTARTLEAVSSLRFADPNFDGTVRPDPDGAYAVRARGGIDALVTIDSRTALPSSVQAGGDGDIVFSAPERFEGAAILGAIPFDRIERLTAPPQPPPRPPAIFGATTAIAFVPGARLPIVPCRLETLPLRCLFDTGTSPSSITLSVAERLGREPRGHIIEQSLLSYPSGAIAAGPVTVGSATLGTLHYAVIPSTRDRGYDIVLGSDVLDSLRLDIDLGARRLTLSPSGTRSAGYTIPLSFEAGLPYVPIDVDGIAQDALLDTGDEALVAIGYDAYREHVAFDARQAGRIAGVLGDSDALAGVAADVRIGGMRLGSQRVVVVRSEHVGHVGLGLTARCGILGIDLRAGALDCESRETVPH